LQVALDFSRSSPVMVKTYFFHKEIFFWL